MNQAGLPPHQQQDAVMNLHPEDQVEDSGEDSDAKPSRRSGRRKIKIEYIEDKNRRHITFSKRKAGIMKKAYELSTLTGTQVLLLVVSETGLVYTFTTVKLQPIVTKPEGKNLIQACLNAPDPMQDADNDAYGGAQQRVDIEKKPKEVKVETTNQTQSSSNYTAPSTATVTTTTPYPPYSAGATTMPPMNTTNYGQQPNYNATAAAVAAASYQQQSPQQSYMTTGAPYYMQPQQQQQQQQGYWPQQQPQQQGGNSPSLRHQEDDPSRRGPASTSSK